MGNIFFKRILPRGTEKTNHAVVAPLPVSQAKKLPFFTKKLTLAEFFFVSFFRQGRGRGCRVFLLFSF